MELLDESATRSSIIEKFNTHLRWNPDIRHGDTIVFYFSGHGTCAPAPEDWPAERKQVELLCPHDYAPSKDVHGIPDHTLDALIQALKVNKGDNIVSLI